jgi:hypothetical protein
MRYMHLRLTRKPENNLHGLDLSRARVGDIIVVTAFTASKLMPEGWAVEVPPSTRPNGNIYPPSREVAS